jgi:O-antigen ligase
VFESTHNIYLRALGELGVVGFATLIAMMALPFRKQLVNLDKRESVLQKNNTAILFYIGIVILVGMLHSEYITTALSTCMLFWLCYAETIRGQTATS